MQLIELKPKKALNKAFLKVKPNRTEIEGFKTNLIQLLDRTNDTESEEFHKNLVSDFLKKTYYDPNHFINTKGRNDLVIHNGNNASSSVGVIIEAKKPTNKTEMISTKKLNTKAFQELVLYYLRERITHKNIEVKHLVATNINEWFIFDAILFDRLFAQNKNFVKQFTDFEAGRLADTKTDFFYKQIAEPFIAEIIAFIPSGAGGGIEFTYFDLQDYQKPLRNNDKEDDHQLIALFKLLSAEHLLKLPFTNDSNSLDKRFYSELLHIIGLSETKEGSKKLIGRNKDGERNSGSIIEDAIIQLDSLDKINRLERPSQFGNTQPERLFNVALELSITWVNRILFLKLLEAQLITYHKGDQSYSFLNSDKIKNYDDLNSLFFQVLARKFDERNEDVKKAFQKVPYLNSSLFEPTEIEQVTLFISNLKDDKTIPVISSTVLKNDQGKKRTGNLTTLAYLFEFLNAYDFAGEGSEEIQEDNKSLINASVLGLIFEKINGYKDGSFFTPGFITMYMCRETIRKSVVQKFNETKKWNCASIDELYDKIEDRKEANGIVNSIKICDPAVGSGHFLVSALNEMIAVKNDLRILGDRTGKRLKEYQVEVVNDELIVTDEEGELFEYNPTNKESQRIQETLFHEKQIIIENCLFGVDINPNSVKICRLRLWIELLKNAYYKWEGDSSPFAVGREAALETLPNIDINIKCGNSLVSRFAIDADLSQALKKSKWTIDSYRLAVDTYRNAESKEQKREMEKLIALIKSDFRSEISLNDPKAKKLRKLSGEIFQMTQQTQLFAMGIKEKAAWNKKLLQLTTEAKKLEIEIEDIKANKIFENAFEWRFEFPEVLNDEGEFVGFDVVIGNPPYIRIQDLKKSEIDFVEFLNKAYQSTGKGNYDIYIPFVELGYFLLHNKGQLAYIMPHKFLNANYGVSVRKFLCEKRFPTKIIHFGSSQVFEDATTYTGIFFMDREDKIGIDFVNWEIPNQILTVKDSMFTRTTYNLISEKEWGFLSSKELMVMERLKKSGITLETVTNRIFQGLKTSADKIFILKKLDETENSFRVYSEFNEAEFELEKHYLFPLIKGGNSRAYNILETELLILFPYSNGKLIELNSIEISAPKTFNYLNLNSDYLENREAGKFKGQSWYQFGRNQAIEIIKNPKIFTPDIAPSPRFSFDLKGDYMFTGGASGGYGIVPKLGISNYFLLGILNSKVSEWFVGLTSTQMRGGWLSYESRFIKNIPMPSKTKSIDLEELVAQALSNEKLDENLETEINQLVYKLYDLTEEEIKIVEGV